MTYSPAAEPPSGGWQVPFVRPDLPAASEVAEKISAAIESGMLTKGPHLARLEADAADLLGVEHVVGVSSCTVGLALVLRSLGPLRARAALCQRRSSKCIVAPSRGGSERDEVILPSFNFLAAPAAVVWAGLRPVFVDVDPRTFTIDPACVSAAISDRTAAIMACHTFGCPCDVPALEEIACRAGVPLLFDAAHGLGTSYRGRQVGAGGLAEIFSMSPTKLVVAGEGGLIATSCGCLAELLREAREYGNDGLYGCRVPGLNGRLPEISAVLAQASLARLSEVARRRRDAAATYVEALSGLPGVSLQAIPVEAESSWKDFAIGIDQSVAGIDRDGLRARLATRGIDTRAYYAPACHQMEAFAGFVGPDARLPVTERLVATLLALPMGGHVSPDVANHVAGVVRESIYTASAVEGRILPPLMASP